MSNLKNIKNTGFKIPDNYFSSVEDNITDALKLEKNFLYTAKETGFKIPENYFDTLEKHINTKIEPKNTSKVIRLFSKRNLIYASGIAAAVLLFFNLSLFDKSVDFESLDFQTVESYIINEGIDSYELAALFTENDLTETDFLQQAITDESLETYLLDHLDIENIIID